MLVNPHNEYDIFNMTDYVEMSNAFREQNIQCPNLGNRLWLQGLISEISCSENTLSYFCDDLTKDYINENFDMVVAPMANVFNAGFSDLLLHLAERFRGIKIPVYVIACGVQTENYDKLNDLCDAIKQPAQEFMKSVYNTGGEFALRGYFTKEFFDRLGFKSAVVTGCPSLYQLGRKLQVPNDKVTEKEFRPLINGDFDKYIALADNYPNAEFFDQERCFHILHDLQNCCTIRELVHSFGFLPTKWILSERVKMIPDMNDWWNYLRNSGFSFSFGSRIHGSIMPILAGVPAAMEPRDARTREMAEFFEIPITVQKEKSLYGLYLETDYSVFNKNFAQKYDAYEQFLISHGIVERCNSENQFFSRRDVDVTAGNHQRLKNLNKAFLKQQWLWAGYDKLLKCKRDMGIRG